MSMISPPGSSGDEADAPERTRPSLRAPLTLLVLVAFVVAATYFGWRALTAEPLAVVSTGCADQTPGTPDPEGKRRGGEGRGEGRGRGQKKDPVEPTLTESEVTLNVYNATDRAGLAGLTAEQLEARGFVIAAVDNDPLGKTVFGVAEVRFGKAGRDAAEVVMRHVEGTTAVRDDRTSESVDLVLGVQYRELVPEAEAVQTSEPTVTSTAEQPGRRGKDRANGPRAEPEC